MTLHHLPRLPRRRGFRIGCLGAGFIMRDCHLVAYRQAGFNPVAVASRSPERAAEVAAHHGIEARAGYEAILADPSIEILDIAVPPDAQPAIILDAARRGTVHGILAQKPLALTVAEGRACVEACEKAGVRLAVNQNMRYDQSVRAMKDLLGRGWIGEPVLATIDMRAVPHWMPWSRGLRSLSTYIMSIHHLDTMRYWFGTPARVLASTRPDPRTTFEHTDGINLWMLEYDGGLRACGWDDVWAGPAKEGVASDIGIRWRVEGTEGLARGTIGWPTYPERTPSTLDYATKRTPGWVSPRWDEVWFPDAFVGTMAQLLCAVEDGTEPETGGRDNLETLALCEAVLVGAREHRVTTVGEFL